MNYTITLSAEYDKALAALIADSGINIGTEKAPNIQLPTAEALIQSAAQSMLQSRVAKELETSKSVLLDEFNKAAPTATKASILAIIAAK